MGEGHPDYATSYGLFTRDTKQYGKRHLTAATQTGLVEDASRLHLVGSFQSRVPRVAHVTPWGRPIGLRGLSWAERKEEGQKNIFSFAIFNLATPKVVLIYCVLRYIKVNSLFMKIPFGRWKVRGAVFPRNASGQM